MLFNVPQYIDVEDKIAGPLTGKQLLWMFGMGAVLLIMWGVLEKGVFFMAAAPVVGIFSALAFYKPHGQPLIKFIVWGISFAFRPKVYIWKRDFSAKPKKKEEIQITQDVIAEKNKRKQKILSENIEDLSKTLDSEGKERNEKILELIKKNIQTKK
jgi:hypothetical protein